MQINAPTQDKHVNAFLVQIKEKSDRLINYFMISFFITGLLLAFFYDTWEVAIGVGALSLTAYYSARFLLPRSDFYQYVLGVVFGIFMAQFIYQMHGMFEMHFIAFVGSTLLITYQNWKLQIPLAIVVIVHHALFGYLQYIGYEEIYFTQLEYMDLQTFLIHGALASLIFFICGLWAYHFKKYSERHISLTYHMAMLEEEGKQKKALEMTNEELRKSHQELDKFVYSVSHDLRAPLVSMLGVIEITESTTEEELTAKHMQMMRGSIKRMDKFISDILDYSRNARGEVNRVSVDFEELVKEVVQDLRYMVTDFSHVAVSLDIKQPENFCTDDGRLRIIMNNLISNALRYHDTAALQPYVKVSAGVLGSFVRVEVEDNGIGIPKEQQKKVFDMFYRVSEKSNGSGLGLYIVKETVDKLNGTVEIQSGAGTGTKFIITLPNLAYQS